MLFRDDPKHSDAAAYFAAAIGREPLITHNYVVVESAALVQRRLGSEAVRGLLEQLVTAARVHWVDQRTHTAAAANLLASGSRRISLVDWVSFEVMREWGIDTAFAFDEDFRTQGFQTVP